MCYKPHIHNIIKSRNCHRTAPLFWEAQISTFNQLLSKSLDSSADCIRHSPITAAPGEQSLSEPKLIRAKVLNDCCRQHRYRTHSGSVMCRLAPQQSRLQHLKNVCIIVLWCHMCCLCREQSFFFFFTFSLPPVTDSTVVFLTVAFILNDLFDNFSSTIELSSSYILPLQTTDKIDLLPPSGLHDKWIICACSVVRNTL